MTITEISRTPVNGNCAVVVRLRDQTGNETVHLINRKDMQTGTTVDIDAKVAQIKTSLGG